MHQWTQRCLYFFETVILFPSSIYQEVELLDHIVALNVLRSLHIVFLSGFTNLNSQQQCTIALFDFLSTPIIFCLFDNSHYNNCEVNFTVALICVSLMINDIEHLLI